jgi:hypothetical protein
LLARGLVAEPVYHESESERGWQSWKNPWIVGLLVVIWASVAVVAVLVLSGGRFSFGPVGPVSEPNDRFQGVEAGDCIDATEPGQAGVIVDDDEFIRIVPCDDPHFAETVFVGTTEGRDGEEAYPGVEWLSLEAQMQCADAFAEYVGVPMEESTLFRYVWFSAEEAWAAGNRKVACAVYDQGTLIDGTLRDAGR